MQRLSDEETQHGGGRHHHPDILVHGWNRVRLTLSTPSEGGLTQADLDMARGIDGLGVSWHRYHCPVAR